MKHLKYFENINSNDPIDVEMDVVEFREKFDQIPAKFRSVKMDTFTKKKWEDIDIILNKLVSENPTMTDEYKIFRVWNSFDQGRYSEPDYISNTLLRAVNKDHALVKLSLIKKSNLLPNEHKNWNVEEITEKEIKSMIREIESQKEFLDKRLKNIINIR
jgi:hypothetical protein